MKEFVTAAAIGILMSLAGTALAATRSVTLSVENMTCPVCPITVKKALNGVAGVSKTEVSFERKEAVVTYDDAKTNVEALIQATTNGGYPASVKAK